MSLQFLVERLHKKAQKCLLPRNLLILEKLKIVWKAFFKKRCFHVSLLTSIDTAVNNYFQTENILNKLMSNIFYIRLVTLETKQWFATLSLFEYQLSLLDCRQRALEYFFQVIFLKANVFFFLLAASRTCLMPRQDFFILYFAQSRKILSKL